MSEGKGFGDALSDLETASGAVGEGRPGVAGGAAEAASHPTVAALRAKFGPAILHHAVMAGDEHVVRVPLEQVVEILRWLKSDAQQRYDLLKDVTAVDWGGGRPLELVYELWSIPKRRGLRIKASVPLSALEADSVARLYATADWLEREVYDMFGIRFRNHPDLRRILMPDNYEEGYPLRKDFPLRGRFTRAEQTRRSLAFAVEEYYTERELAVAEEAEREDRVPGGAEVEP
ncbi:MAG: NADH-quinone oxidoreductase subunit C [Longimicrobiales bacterium]